MNNKAANHEKPIDSACYGDIEEKKLKTIQMECNNMITEERFERKQGQDNKYLGNIELKEKEPNLQHEKVQPSEEEKELIKLSGNKRKLSSAKGGRWTKEEHNKFIDGLKTYGNLWLKVSEYIGTRTASQTRSHAQKYFFRLTMKEMRKAKKAPGKKKIFVVTRHYLNRTAAPGKLLELSVEAINAGLKSRHSSDSNQKADYTKQKLPQLETQQNQPKKLPQLPEFNIPKPQYPLYLPTQGPQIMLQRNQGNPNAMLYLCYCHPYPQFIFPTQK